MEKGRSERDSISAEKQESEREIATAIKWQNSWKTATNWENCRQIMTAADECVFFR